MSNKQCMTRLQKEYKTLLTEPVPGITAHPTEKSLLEWHYVLQGPVGSEYEGGVYHGKLVFPAKYPFAGPAISMCTPSGRFTPNAKLCLSMSDFHPESWNPMWSCGSILNGLLSFMLDSVSTTGSMASSPAEKAQLAAQSLAYNCKNPAFKKLFPERVEEHARNLANPPSPRTQVGAAGGGGVHTTWRTHHRHAHSWGGKPPPPGRFERSPGHVSSRITVLCAQPPASAMGP
ncbi:MAG: hypothetical protein WDW38_007690 [Sanguina aurantia]